MNKSYTKHLLQHSLIYGSADILTKFLGFALLPLYTRYLTPQDYGILQLLIISSNLAAIFMQLGLGSAIFKSILHDKEADRNTIFSTAFYALIVFSVALVIPCVLFSSQLSSAIAGNPAFAPEITVLLFSILLKNFAVIPFAKLRIEDKSFKYATVASLKFSLQLLLNIYFLVVLKQGIMGIIYAEFFSSLVFAFVFLWILSGNLVKRFSKLALKNMLGFGIPLVPAALAMFVINMSNRYFLEHFATMEEVGLFSLGYRFGSIMALAVAAFQRAWPSTLFTIATEPDAPKIYAQNFTRFVAMLSLIALVVSVFAKDILQLMTTEGFVRSYRVVPYICISYLFYGIYFYTAVGFNLKKKTSYQALVVTVAAIANLLLNYGLIPLYGMMGAAMASTISFMLMGLMAAKLSNAFYAIPFEFGRLIRLGVVTVPVFLLGFNIQSAQLWASLLYKTCVLISYPVILYLVGFFDETERLKLKNLFYYFSPARLLYRIK